MKAVVYHGVGDIRVDDVAEPSIQEPNDAIVRLTSSAICGTDLHFVRGTMSGMRPGTILGHEGVGIVEEIGTNVRNLRVGDRVVMASTIACGFCVYCRAGYYAQCDTTEPKTGTAFFGGPEAAGAYDGMQAELVRVPYANVGCVKLPDDVTDDQAIMLSDIFPTAWFGAKLADVGDGDTVAVFGAGPVGVFAVISAFLQGAGRVISIDRHADRLDMAREQGAEVVNFDEEDPIDAVRELTGGIGPDRVIDAVGVDAEHVHAGPGADRTETPEEEFAQEIEQTAPEHKDEHGAALGRAERGQGGHDRHHRRLPADRAGVPDRRGDEQEPGDPRGELQPPPLHPRAPPARRVRRGRTRPGPHQARRDRVGHRGLRGVRPARLRVDQGRARAGHGMSGAALAATRSVARAGWRPRPPWSCRRA
jgi:threonine dehydrogenase-like Zn-dependent dehydrogenase